jgi:F-type H+-transporting ATPase subunit epsilon
MSKLHFQLVTPEKTVLNEELDSLSCPTTGGQITILPNHMPLVSELTNGELIAKNGKDEHFIHVAGGFVEVRAGNNIIVLADAAEHHFEIDIQRAEAAKKRAQELLKEKTQADQEYAQVAAMLERNLSRINFARKHAHRKAPITGEGVFKE